MEPQRIENPFVAIANKHKGTEGSQISVLLREQYGQCGEDLIVEAMLRARLTKQRRGAETLFYIEIGANHPIDTNNTFLLYEKYGARGILVDADESLIARLKAVRPRDTVVNSAISASVDSNVTFYVATLSELSSVRSGHTEHFKSIDGNQGIERSVNVQNLHVNEFLARYASRDIDFLCIDCEGIDLEIIAAIDFSRFKPYIVQCEPSEHIVPGTREKITAIMENSSYRLIAATDINLIFVQSQQASARDIAPIERARAFGRRVLRRALRKMGFRRPR